MLIDLFKPIIYDLVKLLSFVYQYILNLFSTFEQYSDNTDNCDKFVHYYGENNSNMDFTVTR